MLDDVREHPATWTLATAWVVMFLTMQAVLYYSSHHGGDSSTIGPGTLSVDVTHLFGDMTFREIRQGEIWRALTATFIHYSFFHLLMNVFGLIQLGRLIEPWYGSGPFLALCLVLGTLGNLVGTLGRQLWSLFQHTLEASPIFRYLPDSVQRWLSVLQGIDVHSAGGSTVLLGLMGVALVVGGRSRTRIGAYLRDQMWTIMGFTAFIGLLMPTIMDNFGHAGGAVVGLIMGYFHRPLIRLSERRNWQLTGSVVALGLVVLSYSQLAITSRAEILAQAQRFQLQQQFSRVGELEQAMGLLRVLQPIAARAEQAYNARLVNDPMFLNTYEFLAYVSDPKTSTPNPAEPNTPPPGPSTTPAPNRPNQVDPRIGRALSELDTILRMTKPDAELQESLENYLRMARKSLQDELSPHESYELTSEYRELLRRVERRRLAEIKTAQGLNEAAKARAEQGR